MKMFFALFFVALIVFLLWELPVVTGRGVGKVKQALADTEAIELSGKTLFISDLHLTAEPALEEQFNLDFSDVQNVVIVGDFFHSPQHFAKFARLPAPERSDGGQGSTDAERLRNVLENIVPKNFSGQIFFIFGKSHDPQLREITKLSFERFEFQYLGEYGKFLVNGIPVVSYHGHQLHGGIVGGGISWLAEKLGVVLPLEKMGKQRFDIAKDTWVINGHSHVPGIDHNAKVGNTGSFVGAPFNKIVFNIHVGTGILFDSHTVELLEYEGLNIKKLYPFSI